MHRLKNRGIVVLTVIGMFAFSGIAMAEDNEETESSEDTVFNYGYDPDNQFLIWNVTSLDYEPDEELLTASLFESYEDLLNSCSLEGDTVSGYEIDGGELTLLDDEGTPLGLEDLDERCGELLFGEVGGPNGQVNHGMFMKLFNEMYDMYDGPAKRGCLIRHIAQSDLGKGDQQVKVSDVDETEPETGGETIEGSIDFKTVEADCIKGEKGEGKGGPPDHVLEKWKEKWPDGKPGKPAHAGGPNG